MNYFVALFFIMLIAVIGFLGANAVSLWRSRPQGAKVRRPSQPDRQD